MKLRLGALVVVVLLVQASRCSITSDIGDVCQDMWNEDTNSLKYGVDFTIDKQNPAKSYVDSSGRDLFTYVNTWKLRGPTYTTFINLLDNYYMKIGITERLTDTEKQENRNFLKAVMQTNVFRKMHAYLLASASRLSLTVPSTQSQFEDQLYKIWFYFYNRGAYRDSSGFEHVFVGEKYDDSKSGKKIVKGYHSWLQFYLQEKRRDADYHGYYALSTSEPRGLKLKFDVNNYDKVVSSFFLGTSPEFEFSLYTACFYLRPGQECTCRINSQTIKIRTYTQGRFVGTAFPLF
ncbi:predicted protein [Nematostella vectensis]|uniref:Uridylate-specific endoribonuclease n=1 Tax=Nematostella vectensis TaxID=45351 RepID=A7T024_NEMVE|nr:predicted protein [Nematostella vectensis]|eukprot:XP_001622792.1 hypothetical protein NEMVEDRAFT_v1g248296 [Nematostella vectensis]